MSVKSLAGWADRLVYWAAVVLLLALLAVVVFGVFFRQINQPLAWSDELAQYLLVWTGFVGWIIAARRRSHIRIMIFAGKLPRPAQVALEIATQLSVIVFAAILLRYSWGLVDRNWDVESIALPITAAALYVPMPFAALALMLQALAEIGDVLAGHKVKVAEPGAQAL
ncbi:TRAP transporter small permease [Bosea thiooxidans]